MLFLHTGRFGTETRSVIVQPVLFSLFVSPFFFLFFYCTFFFFFCFPYIPYSTKDPAIFDATSDVLLPDILGIYVHVVFI